MKLEYAGLYWKKPCQFGYKEITVYFGMKREMLNLKHGTATQIPVSMWFQLEVVDLKKEFGV